MTAEKEIFNYLLVDIECDSMLTFFRRMHQMATNVCLLKQTSRLQSLLLN